MVGTNKLLLVGTRILLLSRLKEKKFLATKKIIGGKNSHTEFSLLHMSNVVKVGSCIMKKGSAHSKNNNFDKFPTSTLLSFQVSRHDFKNKEQRNSIKLGKEQNKKKYSLNFGKI